MALNPQLFANGMPVPFVGEMFVLARDGVEFEIDKIVGSLFVRGEKFNQPIFHCNNISGYVEPVSLHDFILLFLQQVVPEGEHRALYSTHSFKILFKEGGCGTFVPLFLNLIATVRQYNQHAAAYPAHEAAPRMDPLQAAQTPVDEMMRHAYVDPNDPTKIFLQQPTPESQLRRRTYHPQSAENSY
ncbi:hypothetical protein GW17_00037017 [Ensete ventricosum]|nr:hypothetical protein GW17_00037017 [Ensete ventricosum]RZR96839.1 hypothetical protein BHM03_00025986 [Ensete ventricosum]